MTISEAEKQRYLRNVLLPEVGWTGQERFGAARVAVVGAGGIGSACLLYLAAAGVGQIGVVDGDVVEPANLQRQILHREADLGRRKAASAQETLTALNPHCQVKTFDQRLEAANIGLVLKGYDLVLDASDNFPTRFLVADFCWLEKIPLISAAASGFQGLLLVVEPAAGNPCYRCLMPALPPAGGGPEGILGAVAGVMGSLQAVEALKFLLGRGSGLSRRLLSYDGLKGRFHTMDRVRNPDCSGCKYYDC